MKDKSVEGIAWENYGNVRKKWCLVGRIYEEGYWEVRLEMQAGLEYETSRMPY